MRPKRSDKPSLKYQEFVEERKRRHKILMFQILKYIFFALAAISIAILLIQIPWSFLRGDKWVAFTYKDTGTIGDTYGGLLGPPIAFIAAILTFAAFWVQYQANQQQRKDIADQKVNWLYERFENRFFELLKLHKENVNEMRLTPDINGRECFAVMYEELKEINSILLDNYKSAGIPPEYELDVSIEKIAYYILFYGFETTRDTYSPEFNQWEKKVFDKARQDLYAKKRMDEDFIEDRTKNLKPNGFKGYVSLKGHADILGHYYRHLNQTAKFIMTNKTLKDDEKYEYLKTLRAQLSNFEQLMLYYNAVALYPELWYELFTRFKFIKNIRLDLAVLGQPPHFRYSKEMNDLWKYRKEKMFENQPPIFEFEPEPESQGQGK